jgi:hypothetical protein
MSFACPYCGEELFGEVNRCWACAKAIYPSDRAVAIVEAILANEEELVEESLTEPTLARQPPTQAESPEEFQTKLPWNEAKLVGDDIDRNPTATRLRKLERQKAAVGGAIAANVVGVGSLIGAFFTVSACVGSVFGILLGIWGCQSKRWGWAIAGILTSVLAFVLAISFFSVDVYQTTYGHLPWESAAESEIDEDF